MCWVLELYLGISSEQPLEIFHLSKGEKEIGSQVTAVFLDCVASFRPFGQLKCGLWGGWRRKSAKGVSRSKPLSHQTRGVTALTGIEGGRQLGGGFD